MVLFDTDQDGRISTNEMDQSAVALKNLDRDQDGSLTRETHVWTQGQDGWKTADEVDELAQLFTVMPPPPPPPAS
jgi:Ca2+-binding EF-hand superfamily protein